MIVILRVHHVLLEARANLVDLPDVYVPLLSLRGGPSIGKLVSQIFVNSWKILEYNFVVARSRSWHRLLKSRDSTEEKPEDLMSWM